MAFLQAHTQRIIECLDLRIPTCAVVFLFVVILLRLLWPDPLHVYPRLPPGPRPLPFIGNAHQLPAEYQQDAFAEWGSKFGELVYARFFRTPVLVLNHAHTARTLLEKRGAKYASRPPFTFQTDIAQWDHLIIMPYSDRWRRQRRWFQTALLARRTLDTYAPLQHREVRALLRDVARDPGAVLTHVRRYTAALMFGIGYGYAPTSMDDQYIRMTEETIKLVLEGAGPGSMLVDFLPALQYLPAWMPGMDFKRRGLRARALIRNMERIPLERVKQEMEAGTAQQSMATVLLEEARGAEGKLDPAEEREIEMALAILYIAGTDTTSATLSTFILLMTAHPAVQRAAQAELDAVLGPARLPTLADRAALPYLGAVLKEVYRWLAPAPLGTPHLLTEPDAYAGYDLPKDTVVLTNIWAMSRDEAQFPDPERFDPTRFLNDDAPDPRTFVFGFGRRLCPGRVLADSSIFLAAASLLAAFEFQPVGEVSLAPSAFTSGVIRHPKPFKCAVLPRGARGREVVG